jgi:hypothetical protein
MDRNVTATLFDIQRVIPIVASNLKSRREPLAEGEVILGLSVLRWWVVAVVI